MAGRHRRRTHPLRRVLQGSAFAAAAVITTAAVGGWPAREVVAAGDAFSAAVPATTTTVAPRTSTVAPTAAPPVTTSPPPPPSSTTKPPPPKTPKPKPKPPATRKAASPASAAFGGRFVAQVRGYFGVPYLWGGESRSGMDCSGLVWRALKDLGVSAPRTSAQQAAWTIRIPAAQARPGDLVFLGSPVHHVGVYLGNGRMIDNSHPGTVVTERPLYQGSFFGRIPS